MQLTTFPEIQGPYLDDILDQPAALARTITRLSSASLPATLEEQLRKRTISRVLCTGMGSSFHALYPLHRRLLQRKISSHWLETSELISSFETLLDDKTLLIVASQSGQSAEVQSLMTMARDVAHLIGITNDPHSSLGRASQTLLTLDAGPESTVSCKTYLSTLAVVMWLISNLVAKPQPDVLEELRSAQRAVSEYLLEWRSHVEFLMGYLEQVQTIFVTGRGDSLASAGTGGLILKESTRQPAEGMSCAAFRHGPLEMCTEKSLVLIFEGAEPDATLNRRLAVDIARLGGRAALISSHAQDAVFRMPNVPDEVRPILEMLPVQMISLARAALSGHIPGQFERASKITTTS